MNSRKQASIFGAENYGKTAFMKSGLKINNTTQDSKVSLKDAIEDFILMAKVDGRADKTLQTYDYVFKKFLKYLNEDILIGDLKAKSIRKYLAHLMNEGLKNTTVAIHHRVLNAFFNWLVEDGQLVEAPTKRIDEPKTPDKFPKVLDVDQIKQLLCTAKNWRKTWAGYRNFVMIVTFLDTGLRLNELVNMKLEDLDLKRRSIKVHGKGAKDRNVYFGKRTSSCLRHWLRIRDSVDKIWGETVFISQNGDKLKRRHVQRLITRIQKKRD